MANRKNWHMEDSRSDYLCTVQGKGEIGRGRAWRNSKRNQLVNL